MASRKYIWRWVPSMLFCYVSHLLPVDCQALKNNTKSQGNESANIERLIKSNPRRALAYLRGRLIQEPDNLNLLAATGCLETELEQPRSSIGRLQRYLSLDPKSKNVRVYIQLANDFRLTGRVDKSLDVYNLAISKIPSRGILYCERGCVYATLQQLGKGIQDLNVAIGLEPKNAHFYVERGELFAHKNCFSQAADDLTTAIKIGSPTAMIYSRRAVMYNKMGKAALAKKDLEQANEFGLDMLNMR